MQLKTEEMTFTLRPDNIVEIRVNEGITELTSEGVEDVITTCNRLYASNGTIKAALLHTPSFYIKKDVLKAYIANRAVPIAAAAAVTPSFSSRIIGNLLLTLRNRFFTSNDDPGEPAKIFSEKEKAVEWLLTHLEEAKK